MNWFFKSMIIPSVFINVAVADLVTLQVHPRWTPQVTALVDALDKKWNIPVELIGVTRYQGKCDSRQTRVHFCIDGQGQITVKKLDRFFLNKSMRAFKNL